MDAIDIVRADDTIQIVRVDDGPKVIAPAMAESTGRRGIDDWEDRSGVAFELGAGASAGAVGIARSFDGYAGGTLVFGVHHHLRLHRDWSEKGGSLESEGARWCVPIFACGGIGMIFAPTGAILANDLGLELRAGAFGEAGARGDGAVMRVSLRPVLRYARGGARTATYLGTFVPEVGVVAPLRASPVMLSVAWPIYPVDVLVAPGLALAIEPLRAGVLVPLQGGPAGADVGTEVGLRWVSR